MPTPLVYALAFFLIAAGLAVIAGSIAFLIGWRRADRNIARMRREFAERAEPLNPRARDRG